MHPLVSLVIDALDEFNYLQEYHQLLEIAIDQPPERIALPLKAYLQAVEPHIEELGIRLHEIQQVVTGEQTEVSVNVTQEI